MPLTQPKRNNPLMKRYLRETGLSSQALAKRCGVSHSQMYMARQRNVGPDNAEKIVSCVARILGLSEKERLELKAEIMGDPGNLLHAYLGNVRSAMKILEVHHLVAAEILDPEKSITNKSGARALERLRELGAPKPVIESVDRRLMPPPEPRRGLVTFRRAGPEVAAQRKKTRESLKHDKPLTHQALQDVGLTLKEIRQRAGVGKETMRKALYRRCGKKTASAIAGVLAEALSLSEECEAAIIQELKRPPQINS